MIVEVIGESITLLFRLGILVRKASPTDRFKRALQMSSAPFNESFDISYVTEKHPKMKDSGAGWLTTRLGRIISQRRLFIKYSRDHKVRLAFDGAIPDQLATQTERQSSKASTFHLEQLPMSALASATPGTQMQQLEEEDVDDVMSVMSASTMSDNLSVLRLPSLADLSVDGKPFECPICFTLQHFHREKAWRVHAFRDLKAYVCTAGGPDQCESEYFGDRNTWFEHELYQHRSQYVCALCQDDQPVSRAVFRLHMAESHQQVPEQQVAAVEDLSRQTPTHFDAADCPFCDDWAEQIRQRADTKGKRPMVIPAAASRAKSVTLVSATRFKRHVALHQEQLAIFALPRHTEDGDVQDSDEAGRSLSSGSLSTLSQASSQSGARMEAAGLDKDTPMIGEEESSLREPHTISGTAMNNNLDTIELDFHEHFLPLCVQLSINQDLSPEDSKEEFHLLCMKVRREVFSKLWQANTGGSKELRARKEAIEREVQGVLLGLSEAVAEKTHKKPPDHEWANLGQSTVHQATLQARSLMEAMDIPPTVLTQLLGRVVPHDTKTWSQLRQWRTVTPISMEIQTQLYSIQFRQFGTMLEQLRHSPAPDPEPEFQPEPRPSPLPFSATETQTPADPSAIRTLIMPDHMRWVFMDSQGTTLGPLDGLEMHRRFQAKLFTLDTRVKRLEDPDFEYLSQLSQRLGNSREPFLVPQVGISYGPPPQTGSAMLDLRRLSIANTDVQDQRPELLKWLGSINEEGKRGDQNGEPVPSGTANGHRRGTSHESISWLDPIDESGGSSASSVHLRSSSLRIRRKHIRAASGDTDAEFEAALDDAIEAAYDDGFKSESDFHDDNSSEDKELIPEDNAAMKATPLDERGVTEAYERGRMEFDELEGPHADARRAALGAEPKQNLGDLASTLEQHLSGTAARYERAQEVDDAGKDDVSGIKIKFEERMRKSTSKHSLSLEFPCNYEVCLLSHITFMRGSALSYLHISTLLTRITPSRKLWRV
ncbi:hypothetical protein B0H66DRAFT_316092 [Apodospora peruviana]|uniref:Oxidoreductase acuF-like C2H2 type zinc-finger domain-containing protein n=1 Tax=Apodospora peruviana TaxID=516989 RepID=A0AAE0M1H8_9PEZI|nr:hypothetical protein B0H66DRAFT_316092 [Apodospora peruviana]